MVIVLICGTNNIIKLRYKHILTFNAAGVLMESSTNSSGVNKNWQDIVWLEVKCNDPDLSTGDKTIEVKDLNTESGENPGWLPDKVEKLGNWFLFDTHFPKCSGAQDANCDDCIHIICGNLSHGNENNSTILFHLDYWQKQIASMIK